MIDRTGGLGSDEEEERGAHAHLHFMPISVKWRGNQSGWEEKGFMISSALMDGCYLWCMIVFCCFFFFFMLVIWYSQSGGHSKNTFCDDAHLQSQRWSKMWYTLSASGACLFKYWLFSQQQQTRRHCESSSLLWMMLFALVIFKRLWSAVRR